jgi:hypothetical protein
VIDGKFKSEVTMKNMKILRNSARQLVKTMLVFGFTSAMGVIPLFAQVTNSGTLANLANGGTLSIDDKTFSGFGFTPSGLTSFDPNQIIVTASENGGIDYLTWSGNISLVSGGGIASADLLLNYIVTANAGTINMIDQAYTGSAINGLLAVDETAAIGAFGGPVAGYSHLQIGDFSDPPPEAGDILNIVPPETVLYVTKDLGFGVTSERGGFISISQVTQSFHQVPEPSAMLLGSLGGGLLLFLRLRRQARRD